MHLFFDTETTGKADFRAQPDAPHQPRLVQLGALLTDEDGREMASIDLIIQPEGFEIPESAAAVHGITTQMAVNYGVELEHAVKVFRNLCLKPHIIVGHNIEYDVLVMRGECLRLGFDSDPFEGATQFCTMQAMTPVCKIPGRYDDYKWPRLQEAYKHAFGKEFACAHSAMDDVRACAEIYWWLKRQPKTAPEPVVQDLPLVMNGFSEV